MGGGYSAGKSFNLINMTRPLDYTDADQKADDYWEVESNSSGVGTKITGYAVCMKEPKLKYATEVAPDSSDAERTLSVACPGKTEPIGGGASISHSDSYLESLYPSGKSFKAEVHDFSDGTGNFAADAICLKNPSVETVKRTLRVQRQLDPQRQGPRRGAGHGDGQPLPDPRRRHRHPRPWHPGHGFRVPPVRRQGQGQGSR